MKKILKLLSIGLSFSMLFVMTAWADNFTDYNVGDNNTKTLLLSEEDTSQVHMIQPRGLLISQAVLGISNEGKGKIGVYSQVLAHVPVDRVYMKIYLDRLENDVWVQQQVIELDFYQEDYPDEEMTMPDASFNLTGYSTGYYYRLRGMYLVEKYSTGQKEVMSATTNGILLTKTP